ncbi:VWA domain-containing protein [Streptococcus oralis]|uniref:VWA domain-containing protein n=1 Tax=Streptococcus oralis TaxID=1303 RepID=UPI00066C5A39|nr:VWA domain-containing protein [Streptococcus oralis]AQA07336.1 LPXTG cell wall anchor domain protein [Streptococcus oralis]MBN6010830.1 VWA domain-containing protein [Streptococcus oralis subsp. oralis]MCP9038155.1 VWA domain-containing protein [Streptococcus oralis]MCP9052744.1 VWA domain-containing protein [Streptococcus oralis]MCP9057775.1 VWA domain-containing protein [Streptococcus oralis]
MDKSFMKQQRFSFRKMKVGLASVAILFAFAQVGQVSADETTQPASTSAETVKKTEANKSAVEAALAEIKADEAKPVVNQSDAKPGELVDVSKKVSPIDVKERQEGDQKIHEETATVEVTKTEVAPVKSEELPAPKTETTESTVSGKDEDGNSYTQYERVDKTTTVEIKKATRTISKSNSADIVFVVDRSASMYRTIDTVRNNINEFARNLAKDGVAARFGLATFSDEVYGRIGGLADEGTILTKFNESYFTSDPAELEKALAGIKIAHSGDFPETSTPALTQIISTYDWSKSPKNKKFVVLLTDAPMKEDPSIPTMANTLASLKAAKIERIVATSTGTDISYKDFVSEGRLMNIDRNLADSLTKDATTWIVETVTEGHNYKVTKDNYQFYLERRTTLPIAQTGSATPTTTVPVATAYKKEVAKLPDTGSNDTANYGIVGLGLLMAGLGLTVSNRKSKEQ